MCIYVCVCVCACVYVCGVCVFVCVLTQVFESCTSLRETLAGIDASIDACLTTLNNPATLVTKAHRDVLMAWEDIDRKCSGRNDAIVTFGATLEAVEDAKVPWTVCV